MRGPIDPEVPAFPADRPWIRAVMAVTLDGVMRGPDGGSRSIGTPADQRWFSALRREPDVLLVGAGTIRAEDYRPSRTVVAIVSSSLDLPPTLRMFAERTEAHPRPLVITTARAAERAPDHLRARVDVLPCGDDRVDLALARDALVGRGLSRIQCEGGPALLADVIAAGLLDELLLSITPRLVGGPGADHLLDRAGGLTPPPRMTIASVQQDEGTVFLRLLAER